MSIPTATYRIQFRNGMTFDRAAALVQGKFKRSGKGFVLPGFDGSTPKQKLLMALVIAAAVIWPFLVSRGSVDIATLTLIYVMLGLGLNVVVGLSGQWGKLFSTLQ